MTGVLCAGVSRLISTIPRIKVFVTLKLSFSDSDVVWCSTTRLEFQFGVLSSWRETMKRRKTTFYRKVKIIKCRIWKGLEERSWKNSKGKTETERKWVTAASEHWNNHDEFRLRRIRKATIVITFGHFRLHQVYDGCWQFQWLCWLRWLQGWPEPRDYSHTFVELLHWSAEDRNSHLPCTIAALNLHFSAYFRLDFISFSYFSNFVCFVLSRNW